MHRTDPDSAGEQRFVAVGLSRTQKVVVVVYSLRGTSVRLISARRATRREVKFYAG